MDDQQDLNPNPTEPPPENSSKEPDLTDSSDEVMASADRESADRESADRESAGRELAGRELAGRESGAAMQSTAENVEDALDQQIIDSNSVHDQGSTTGESEWRKLDARNITLETLGGLIVFTFVFVGGAIGVTAVILGEGGFSWIALAVLGGFLLVLCGLLYLTIVWPRLDHRHARWRLTPNGLEIRRGVLWRHHITVPIDRVQHADVSQGPLQRQFGLGTLTVHTAGTQNAEVPLAGLAHCEALQVRDTIVLNREATDGV